MNQPTVIIQDKQEIVGKEADFEAQKLSANTEYDTKHKASFNH